MSEDFITNVDFLLVLLTTILNECKSRETLQDEIVHSLEHIQMIISRMMGYYWSVRFPSFLVQHFPELQNRHMFRKCYRYTCIPSGCGME